MDQPAKPSAARSNPPHGPRGPHRPQRQPQGAKRPGNQELPPVLQEIVQQATTITQTIGCQLPLAFYRTALASVLKQSHASLKQRLTGSLKHREHKAAEHMADFSISGEILVNIHTREEGFTHQDVAKMTAALKFFHHRQGLLLGVGGARVIAKKITAPHDPFPALTQDEVLREAPADVGDRTNATLLVRSLLRVARAHQLGYDAPTWRGLLQTEFSAENIPWTDVKPVPISYQGEVLGNVAAPTMLDFQQRGLILVTALHERWQASDLTTLKHFLRSMKRPWGLLLHFGRRQLEWKWVTQ